MDNKRKYDEERGRRWDMAEKGEPKAIQKACNLLSGALEEACGHIRYDEIWFERYDPSEEGNEWVRGAPDYVITAGTEGYLYAEIKIKAQKFRKTKQGGTTQQGTQISCYGCESFYLDRVPVYENMCAFSQKTGIDPKSFLLLFVSEDMAEIDVISLAEIRRLIRDGYNGQPFCEIKEGYGIKTKDGTASSYLIPENAAHLMDADSGAYFRAHMSQALVLPPERYYAHIYNGVFYHRDRSCKYISRKPDGELLIFDNEAQAVKTGRRRCTSCF